MNGDVAGSRAHWMRGLGGLGLSLGLVLVWYWGALFSPPSGIFDWRKDEFFFEVYTQSLQAFGAIPRSFYALPEGLNYPTLTRSLSYFSNPEVISFSPFFFLGRFLGGLEFFQALFLIHLLIAVGGLFLLAKALGWRWYSQVLVLILVVLNPWLMQHVAIGYPLWTNALLIPLLLYFLIEARERPWKLIAAAVIAATIVYQGGMHVFIWLGMALAAFTGVYSVFTRQATQLVSVAGFLALTTCLVGPKLIASARVYGDWIRPVRPSYASLSDVYGLLTDASTPLYRLPAAYDIYGTNLYDGSLVMGHAWLVLLVMALVGCLWLKPWSKDSQAESIARTSLVCAVLFLALGWNGVWARAIEFSPIFASQIYPYRFLVIAVTFGSLLIVTVFQSLIEHAEPIRHRRLVLAGCVALIFAAVHTSYQRNRLFVEVAHSRARHYPNFDLSQFLGNRLRVEVPDLGVTLHPEVTAAGLHYPLPQGVRTLPIELSWLARDRIRDFEFEGAEPIQGDRSSVWVQPNGPDLRIQPRSYVSALEAWLCLLGFALLSAFVLGSKHLRRGT